MIEASEFAIHCTGDVCMGDEIMFSEAVFDGSFRKPTFLGDRRIFARIVSDSYGGDKQQHTFSLEVIASEGVQPIAVGQKIRRKGRNVYRNGTTRRAWVDEAARTAAINEKHERGAAARTQRNARRTEWRHASCAPRGAGRIS